MLEGGISPTVARKDIQNKLKVKRAREDSKKM